MRRSSRTLVSSCSTLFSVIVSKGNILMSFISFKDHYHHLISHLGSCLKLHQEVILSNYFPPCSPRLLEYNRPWTQTLLPSLHQNAERGHAVGECHTGSDRQQSSHRNANAAAHQGHQGIKGLTRLFLLLLWLGCSCHANNCQFYATRVSLNVRIIISRIILLDISLTCGH